MTRLCRRRERQCRIPASHVEHFSVERALIDERSQLGLRLADAPGRPDAPIDFSVNETVEADCNGGEMPCS
jgi:hypothetical protein